jgi:cytochrome P450
LYDSTTNLVKLWENKARLADGLPFDVNEDLDHSALDGMLSFVFDRHFKHTALGPQIDLVSHVDPASMAASSKGEAQFPKARVHKFISALYETVDKIDVVTKAMSPRLAMWWIRQTPSYKRITDVKRQAVKEQIQGALQRLEATGETRTAIEFMLAREKKAAEKQQRKPNFENPIMMDEIAGQFIAGLHTTSTTLAWTFIYLTRFPHIQCKLRDAIHLAYSDAHDQRRAPTLAELTKTRVPYLEAVLEEALRLHATSIARQATRDTELLGYHIPKGTNVVLIANGPGFHAPPFDIDSKLRSATATKSRGWSEMNELNVFNPERWLVPKEGGGPEEIDFDANAVPQIAFGMGPRGCWGRRMAYLELRLVVSLTVWSFDFLEVPAALSDSKASYGIVHRADQCYLRMRSRSEL